MISCFPRCPLNAAITGEGGRRRAGSSAGDRYCSKKEKSTLFYHYDCLELFTLSCIWVDLSSEGHWTVYRSTLLYVRSWNLHCFLYSILETLDLRSALDSTQHHAFFKSGIRQGRTLGLALLDLSSPDVRFVSYSTPY